MFYKFSPLFVFALALLLVACEPETLTAPIDETPTQEAELAELEAQYHAEMAAIEAEAAATPKSAVVVPAGSSDALAAAIAQAGEGGTVVLAAGEHYESAGVTIPYRLTLRGENGAILIATTEPDRGSGVLEAALHLLNAPRSLIYNLDIRVSGTVGGIAILVENSDRSIVLRNRTDQYQWGVLIHDSDLVTAMRNNISTSPLWATGELNGAHGIVNMNGKYGRIYNNETSGGFTGIWPNDRSGIVAGNETYGNYIGMIFCNVPNVLILPGRTEPVGARTPGTSWSAFFNNAHDNFDVGYLIIDGAATNFLTKNFADANARIDYDFAGETERFGLGIVAPTSERNRAFLFNDDSYVDCGVDNIITGGIEDVEAVCF